MIQPLELGTLFLEQNKDSVTKEDTPGLLDGQPTASATTADSSKEK